MTNSTHRVEVVPVVLEPHPNANALSIVRVFDGYTVCTRTADWQPGQLGAYIPPDSVLDTAREEFAWLKSGTRTKERIKVKRLRGVLSMGLLIPAPAGSNVGDDVAEALGVEHYEPPAKGESWQGQSKGPSLEATDPPSGFHPKYDVESLRRYGRAIEPGEVVMVTEKIHGANARFCFDGERMHCGSRGEWKREDRGILWWRVLDAHPAIEAFCRANVGVTLYGEVYGQVQDLKYGIESGARVAFFDVLAPSGVWVDAAESRAMLEAAGLPTVPLIAVESFNLERALAHAEGPSMVAGADHVREGCVVKPLRERRDDLCGRVCLKVVGNGYMERA